MIKFKTIDNEMEAGCITWYMEYANNGDSM